MTYLFLVECAHIRSTSSFIKPSPYVEITVDEQAPRKTEAAKNTTQPKWNESFNLLVTLQSKIHFAVLDRNNFRKDTVVGEKTVDLYQLLVHSEGRYVYLFVY